MATAAAAATAILGTVASSRASQQAAEQQQETSRLNTQFLQGQGAIGQQRIGETTEQAIARARQIPGAAIGQIQPFATAGTQAFQDASRNILAGGGSGGIADAIAAAAGQGNILTRGLTGPVANEVARQAMLTGQRGQDQANQALLGMGRMGLGAAGDIAGITARGATRVGDIATQGASAGASALVGQVPQIAQQLQTGQEARLLGQIQQQQSFGSLAEQLARLAGRSS